MRFTPMLRTVAAGAALVVSSLAVLAAPEPRGGLTEAQVEALLKKWVEEHPDLIVESINKYVVREKQREIQGKNEQTVGVMNELVEQKGMPVLGNKDGKVTLVYVLDGACGYCKTMTPVIEEIVSKNPDVKVVHRWVSFLSPASEYAARAAFVLWKRQPNRYRDFYVDLMGHRGQLTNDVVDKTLAKVVGDAAALQLRAEIASGSSREEMNILVSDNLDIAHRAGIDGTPTVVVAGIGTDGILRGAQQASAVTKAIEQARKAKP